MREDQLLSQAWWHEGAALDRVILSGRDVLAYLHTKLATEVRPWRDPLRGGRVLGVDIKGRTLLHGVLWPEPLAMGESAPRWHLLLPPGRGEVVAAHLERYVIVEDVSVEAPEQVPVAYWGGEGMVAGDAARHVLQQREGHWIAPDLWWKTGGWMAWPVDVRDGSGLERLIPQGAPRRTVEALHRDSVAAGVVLPGVDVHAEETIPLEAGLWDEVSVTKGCYLGQEVIERMYSRGRPNKRLMRVRSAAGSVPAARSSLRSADGVDSGWVTRAVPLDDGGWEGLAYVRRAALDAGAPLRSEGDGVVEIGAFVGGEAPPSGHGRSAKGGLL